MARWECPLWSLGEKLNGKASEKSSEVPELISYQFRGEVRSPQGCSCEPQSSPGNNSFPYQPHYTTPTPLRQAGVALGLQLLTNQSEWYFTEMDPVG